MVKSNGFIGQIRPGVRVSVPWGLSRQRGVVQSVVGPPGREMAQLAIPVTGASGELLQETTISFPVEALGWDVGVVGLKSQRDDVLLPLVRSLHDVGLATVGDDVSGSSKLTQWVESAAEKCMYIIVVISPETLENPDALTRLTHIKRRSDYIVVPLWKDVGPERVREIAPPLARLVAVNWIEGAEAIAHFMKQTVEAGERPRTPQLRSLPATGPATPDRTSDLNSRLEEWVQKSEERFSFLVATRLAEEIPHRFSFGSWRASYVLSEIQTPPSLRKLLDALRRVKGRETGWAPWWIPEREGLAPYSFEGVLECWMAGESHFQDPAHSDFWHASPTGSLFLVRGYQDDSVPEKFPPGTVLDVTLPVWRVGECLLHASRLAERLDATDETIFEFSWRGLDGRTLDDWAALQDFSLPNDTSHTSEVTSRASFRPTEVEETLQRLVSQLVQPLYDAFLFEPPEEFIRAELEILRRGRV